MNMANESVQVMSDVSYGTAAVMAPRSLPSLFAPDQGEPGHDVRILDALSAGRGRRAVGGRAATALTLGVVLAVVPVLVFVMWERWRIGADEGGREPVDVVAMSAPVVTDVGQERLPAVQVPVMPPVQELRPPAATIVEMPVMRGEQSRTGDSPSVGARAGLAGGRPPREVARAPAASAKSKAAGERKTDARRSAPLARTQSAAPKPAEEQVDADVQVIEAIVTRAR